MTHIYNFGLLFEDTHNSAFVEYSRVFNSSLRSDFCLSDRSLPHLTVLQFEGSIDSAKEFWEEIKAVDIEPLPLDLAGLNLLPSKDGHIWIEVAVLNSSMLRRLQEKAVSLVGSAKIHSGIGNSYRPHITIARALDSRQLIGLVLDDSIVRRKNVIGRISLGSSGKNYQYEEILFDIQ